MKYYKILIFAIIFTNQWLFGQSLQELQRLQSEYKKVLERQALQKPADISEAEKTAKSTALPDKLIYSRKDIESLLVNTENLLKELKFLEDSSKKMPYVGYEFFTMRDSIPFWQNLPISQNYLLGPGDEVIISLWGESNSYSVETINRDGQIFIEKIGVLNLGGKSVDEAKKLILSKYSKVYSTLIGQSPKSFIDLTLGELKSINIHFVGFVNIPGIHIVHPFSNVIAGLIQAGGVDINGSLRDISIIRNNKNIASIDIYDYLIKGKSFNDMRLMDQDIVYITSRKSTIPITGRVKRPGYYEVLENESLADLINYSGGVDRWATKSIFLYKNGISDKSGYLVGFDETSKFLISQGDSVHIPLKQNAQNFVVAHGQIKNPGRYPYNEKMKLNDLISASMSLDDDFIETMDLSSINIFRRNPSSAEPLSIATSYDENVPLKNGDHINIGRNSFYKPIESIIITGEISKPGTYPVNNLTSLSNILNIAGGYTELALLDGVEIFRDSLKIAWEDDEFLLKNGDSLNVIKKTGLILVDGEVNVPGFISYKKGDSVKKYIKRAGGFTAFAQKNNIYVVYPNGTSVPISTWSSPDVKDGSTIIVNPRTISGNNSISGWQAFSIITSQAGNIATTLLSLSIIMSQNNSGN